ncbi:MFS transporter [Shewanella sp. MBTL60-007]|uniref:MFS transporter n=1 Tax=Shewanella sp. MBTL60-007 TaxID=2815911 RepID=UPI001C8169FC|nr:MFS transporter [Shewanella sp. MBTL60-007]
MSLFSMPFVDTGVDTALHGVAAVVMVATVAAAAFGFWKIHELPINKAHKEQHHQIGLITALTWIGFIWHWVWVVAVIVAFVDGEKALRRIRDVWREKEPQAIANEPAVKEEQTNA